MRDYFPRGGGGHIIVTSRNPTWQGTVAEFPVEVFDRQESVDYVLTTTRQDDQATATTLAETLGDLPLALAQAAAYISAAGISLSGYLDRFQRKRAELWENETAPADYGETVATTWAVAMQRLTQEVPTAAAVLYLCAFLAPDDIPRSLLTEHPAALPEELATLAADSLLLDRAIMALRQYALLDANAETLAVHRLVQAVTRDRLDKDAQVKWIKAAVDVVRAAFPLENFSPASWPIYEYLVPHALAASSHAVLDDAVAASIAWLFNETGVYWMGRGQFGDAASVLSRALAARQRGSGPEHPDTLGSMHNLATAYSRQGRYDQARPVYEQALEAMERVLGPEHPDTLTSMNNLANVYSRQGRYDQAWSLHKRALAARQRVLGSEHPDTLYSVINLANVYLRQRRYARARPVYEQALEVMERVLGPEHPDTLGCMLNLATVYSRQGRYDQAQSLHERALEVMGRVLGPEHPDTLRCMNNLADMYADQGRYDQAQPLCEQTLEAIERVLGPEHSDTLASMYNLADVYAHQERYDRAQVLYERAKAGFEHVLGPSHPDAQSARRNLQALRSR